MGTSFEVQFEDDDDINSRNDETQEPASQSAERAFEPSMDEVEAIRESAEKAKKADLVNAAKELGIPNTSRMNRSQLAMAISEKRKELIRNSNRKELNQIAKERGIKGYTKLKKEELQSLLLEQEKPKRKYPYKVDLTQEPKNVGQFEDAPDIDPSFDVEDFEKPVTAKSTSWTKPVPPSPEEVPEADPSAPSDTHPSAPNSDNLEYERLSAGSYKSKDGRIEINKLPDGAWSWAIDEVGYDAESTLRSAKQKAEASSEYHKATDIPEADPVAPSDLLSESEVEDPTKPDLSNVPRPTPRAGDPEPPLFDHASKNPPSPSSPPPGPRKSPIDLLVGVPNEASPKTAKEWRKQQLKLEKERKQYQQRESRGGLGSLSRRANRQLSLNSRREALERRRERNAIQERARIRNKQIREQTDRGDSDRLIRRIATFGIGRAVGIDGGLITALAEVLVFQPEIGKAEQEMTRLLQDNERQTNQSLQELERAKVATGERRSAQSIDIAEIVDDARRKIAEDPENFDIGEVEAALANVLNQDVEDPSQDTPERRTGQRPGPQTSLYPETQEYDSPDKPQEVPTARYVGPSQTEQAQPSRASQVFQGDPSEPSSPVEQPQGQEAQPLQGIPQPTPSPSAQAQPVQASQPTQGTPQPAQGGGGGGGGQVPPTATGGTPPPRGPSPPPGVMGRPPGGPANAGGSLASSMSMTTSHLMMATVALQGIKEASDNLKKGFNDLHGVLNNPSSVGAAANLVGEGVKGSITTASMGIGAVLGGPAGAIAGAIIGKAIGMVLIDPVVEMTSAAAATFDAVAKNSIGPMTLQAEAVGNIDQTLRNLELSLEQDENVGTYVEARTGMALAILDLKNQVMSVISPLLTEVVKGITTLIRLVERGIALFNYFSETALGGVLWRTFQATGIGAMITTGQALRSILDQILGQSTATNSQHLMNQVFGFFGQDPSQSIQGSMRRQDVSGMTPSFTAPRFP